ncbi:MAG: alpha/beta hydrolase [Coprothermobacterota bacterium]|nr:alpha/beta hydrolase [Coprothermobacterota bacterium]
MSEQPTAACPVRHQRSELISLRQHVLAQAGPVTYISPDDLPFLILHGEKDRLVPPSQSQELYDRLQAVSVPATPVPVKNDGYGLAPTGGAISTRAELVQQGVDFFVTQL